MNSSALPNRLLSWQKAVSWLIILLPLFLYLVYLPRFGPLQNNDYFRILAEIVDIPNADFTHDIGDWLNARSNEHRATIPLMIYSLNVKLFAGNNRILSVLALGLLAVVFSALYLSLPIGVRSKTGLRTAAGLFIAAFAFTPVGADSVARGFSGIQWFMANAVSITAIAILARYGKQLSIKGGTALLGLGLIGAFSYTTSLFVWPALIVGAFFLGLSVRKLFFLVLCMVLMAAIYFGGFQSRPYHGAANFGPIDILSYISVYLGSPLSKNITVARWIGGLGLLVTALLQIWIVRLPPTARSDMMAWTMVTIYALVSASAITMGRIQFGEALAMASRYSTLSGLFWAALGVTAGLLAYRTYTLRGSWRPAAFCAVVMAMAMAGANTVRGLDILEVFSVRASRQQVAELGLVRGHFDLDYIRGNVTRHTHSLSKLLPFLKDIRHYPFDREWPTPPPRRVDKALLSPTYHSKIHGMFRLARPVPKSNAFFVEGAAFHSTGTVDEVVLLTPSGVQVGEVIHGIRQTVRKKRLWPSKRRNSGWGGYVEHDWTQSSLRAYVRLRGNDTFYPLRNSQQVTDFLTQQASVVDIAQGP